MALFSKLFDRDAQPYELKGRWYKIVFTSGAVDPTKSDLPVVVTTTGSNNILRIDKKNLVVCDYKFINRSTPASSAGAPNTWTESSAGYSMFYVSQNFTDFELYAYCVDR